MNSEQTINHGWRHWRAKFQRLRVPLGFVTVVLFVIASRPSWATLAIGAPLALVGALIRAWASGHLRKNAELATSGPYAHTRNPLYFGSFVMTIGCAVSGGNWWLGLWLIAFFLLIYWPVMQAEAEHMSRLFAGSYQIWAAGVPLFIPRLTPYHSHPNDQDGAGRFDSSQYLRHREYRALIGLGLVIGVLALKASGFFQF